MSLEVPFAHAFAMERAVRTFLAAQGVPTIPCNEFSGRNAEHQQAPMTFVIDEATGRIDRLVLPDLIRLPTFHALEVKCQGYAPWMRRKFRTTGFKRRHYEHYRRYQRDTGRQVEIAFVHLVEDAIVGGPLDDIEPGRTANANPMASHQDFFWEFSLLRPWPVSLTEMLEVALRYAPRLGREGYTASDHAAVLKYRDEVAVPNFEKHVSEWGPRVPTLRPAPQQELPW